MRIFSKRSGMIAALGVALGLTVTSVAYAAATFGRSRPTFTWAHPANYITFNSITDNPNWPGGDERYFVKARDVNASPSTYTNTAQVTDGEELVVATYFHNNAQTILNLHAKDTKVNVALPTAASSTESLTSYISASNANPGQVWSTMDFTSSSPFTLQYVPGSATIHTAYFDSALSDNVVNSGVLVGSKALDGDVPGCFQFSGYVYIHVKVHKVTTPPPVTPPTTPPTKLPNTGAGSVVGIFAGVSALAGAAHYVLSGRRNSVRG